MRNTDKASGGSAIERSTGTPTDILTQALLIAIQKSDYNGVSRLFTAGAEATEDVFLAAIKIR